MSGVLHRVPAFQDWPEPSRAALEARLSVSGHPDGYCFVLAGDQGEGSRSLFIILEGQCRITRGDGGADSAFAMGAGDLFGLVALVDGGPRTATVLADGPVRVATLTAAAFEAIRAEGGGLAFALELTIARQLARDFAAMNARLLEGPSEAPDTSRDPAWETQESYSGLHAMRTERHLAQSLADITEVFGKARRQGRRVTLRGAGLSFDTQAMGSELSLVAGSGELSVDTESDTFTVGASTTWGQIVKALAPHGLVPAVVVSGSDITVGGTISMNALSRFSPIFGKEGKWIESLEVLVPSGERMRASRTENADLFYGVVGGLGQLGVVLRATYRALRVGTPLRVQSSCVLSTELEELAPALRLAPTRVAGAETSYAIVAYHGEEVRSIITRSKYVAGAPLRTMLPHRPASAARLPIEMAIHNVDGAGQRFWNFAYDKYIDVSKPYVDELEGYTFFMDGNVRTHRTAHSLGVPFRTIQETYVLPSAGADVLAPFLRLIRRLTTEAKLEIALVDALHLPEDEPFLLSSSRGLSGFAVTLTFEGAKDVSTVDRMREVFIELGRETQRVGGRVHLTKNVFAGADTMKAMYGQGLSGMAGLKKRYDPHGLLGSEFVSRIFPSLRA